MAGIARRRLLRFREQHLFMANKQAAEVREFLGKLSESVDRNPGGDAGHLPDRVVQRNLAVERRGGVYDATVTDHRRLDHLADVERDDQRDNAGVWEVDFLDRVASIGQNRALLQLDQA